MSTNSVNHTVSHTVRQFITSHFSHARTRALADDDPLLESGIVDSLGVLDIVGFIESDMGVVVADEDLVRENFGSIGRIASYIEAKQKDMARA
ncbi:MAG TPA: acyl carrier protein [Candidatus Binatia bacterium]|jgi:acyl carrier protein